MLAFFSNHTATTEIYTLSLHDALPISYFLALFTTLLVLFVLTVLKPMEKRFFKRPDGASVALVLPRREDSRSEEHTSELQSRENLVCRLLLEKKKTRAPRETARSTGPI